MSKRLSTLIAIAFLCSASYGIWQFIAFLARAASSVQLDLTIISIDPALTTPLITAVASFFVAGLTVFAGPRLRDRLTINQLHRDKRTEAYEPFAGVLHDHIFALKDSTDDTPIAKLGAEIERNSRELRFTTQAMLWGPGSVIQKWTLFKESPEHDIQENLRLLAEAVIAMRKDLGHTDNPQIDILQRLLIAEIRGWAKLGDTSDGNP